MLLARGHRRSVIALREKHDGQLLPEIDMHDDIEIRRVTGFGPMRYRFAPGVLRLVQGCDIIHIHAPDFFLDFLAHTRALHRKPLVHSTHGGYFHTTWMHGWKKTHWRTITRSSLKNMDWIIADSPQDYERIRRVTSSPLTLIPNGISSDYFDFERSVESGVFLSIGRIVPHKHIDDILRLFSILRSSKPHAHLIICGPIEIISEPGYNAWSEAAKNEIGAELRGEVSEKEKRKLLQYAQFYVSASEYEGFGLSVVEAMAAGVIPILNNIEAFRNLVTDGQNGFIVQFQNHAESAERISRILSLSESELAMISTKARETARKYDWNRLIERFEDVYTTVLSKSS